VVNAAPRPRWRCSTASRAWLQLLRASMSETRAAACGSWFSTADGRWATRSRGPRCRTTSPTPPARARSGSLAGA
jgi:hypothetical protein